MITVKDLQDAINECLNEQSPNAMTCIKLAAYYIILDHMKPSDSDFARSVSGCGKDRAWKVITEMMETLGTVNPRLYDDVMRKLKDRE